MKIESVTSFLKNVLKIQKIHIHTRYSLIIYLFTETLKIPSYSALFVCFYSKERNTFLFIYLFIKKKI